MNRACVVVIGALCCSAPAGDLIPPAGPPAPTMKTLDQIEPRTLIGPDTTPGNANSVYRIASPGSYYLDSDVVAPPGKNGILILSDDVTIDLMGFTVRGPGGTGTGIESAIAIVDRVIVRNGFISGWVVGFRPNEKSIASNLVFDDCSVGLALGSYCIAKNCVAQNCNTGIAAGPGTLIESCVVRKCSLRGISAGTRSVIRNCAASTNGDFGIRVEAYCVVADCTASFNDGYGFYGSRSTFVRCTADRNTLDGIRASDQSIVRDCVSIRGFGVAISLGTGAQAVNCTVRANGGDGITAGDHCLIANNTINSFNGSGIIAGSYCAISGNLSNNHASGFGIQAQDYCRITDNVCNQNAFGIAAARWCTIERNTTAQNFTGITTGESCRISENNSEGNAGNGLEVSGRESLIEGNRLSNSGIVGLQVFTDRNMIIRNLNRLNAQSFDIAADNRVGFTVSPPLSGSISGDSDPDALGAGTTDPWANLAY